MLSPKTMTYGHVDFPRVSQSRENEDYGLKMTKKWNYSRKPRRLRLFGDTIGSEMRDSIKVVHVQPNEATMADEILRFPNLDIIHLSNHDRGVWHVSTIHTLRDKLKR